MLQLYPSGLHVVIYLLFIDHNTESRLNSTTYFKLFVSLDSIWHYSDKTEEGSKYHLSAITISVHTYLITSSVLKCTITRFYIEKIYSKLRLNGIHRGLRLSPLREFCLNICTVYTSSFTHLFDASHLRDSKKRKNIKTALNVGNYFNNYFYSLIFVEDGLIWKQTLIQMHLFSIWMTFSTACSWKIRLEIIFWALQKYNTVKRRNIFVVNGLMY